MIIKIKSHKKKSSFQNLLNYMIHDKDRLFDKEGKSFAITHNLKGDSINEWVKQFGTNEKCRLRKRVDSVIATHEIVSFHKDDAKNISLDKLENIAREYIRMRGGKGMFVAVPHFDKEHYHVHVCASGIEYLTGKSLRLEKKDLSKLKQNIQQYQLEKYPELSKSIVNHGKLPKAKALQSDKEYQYKQRTGRATNKEQIFEMLKTCYKKAISKDDFFMKLKECGLETYIRGGKISGIIFYNKKFRLKTLGFNEEKLQELNKSMKRSKDMGELRTKSKGKTISRNR